MEFQSWLLFVSIASVATITPGPAVILVTSHSTVYGWKHSLLTILGNVSGLFLMSAMSILGLSAIILSSALAFTVIKTMGACYLIYLGVKLWRSGLTKIHQADTIAPIKASKTKAYLQGLAIALSNPKAIAFTTALFPQFITQHTSLLTQFSILVVSFMLLSFTCLLCYSLAAQRAKTRLTRGANRYMNKVFGGLFIGSGGALMTVSKESL